MLGREFMPKLEEGNFWIRATLPLSISLEQSAKYVGRMRAILRGCPADPDAPCDDENRTHPEVQSVVSQLGRPDDGTDVSGFYNIELFAPLKPFDEWPRGMTKEKLTDELTKELTDAFPGVIFNFSQMITDNVEEAVSGVKGENSVKVFGTDLASNEKIADAIVDVMGKVKGIKDLGSFQSMGQPNIKITPRRDVCSRYGLNTGDVDAVIQAAIGGQAHDPGLRGREALRPDRALEAAVPHEPRGDPRDHRRDAGRGSRSRSASSRTSRSSRGRRSSIARTAVRYSPVKFSVRGRDLASTIAEAQASIDREIPQCDKAPTWMKLCRPYDTHLEWGGEINELNEAEGRLTIIIPLTLLLIAFLTYSAVKNWVDTLIVLMNIPVACTGGVLALLATGVNFSVSAAMGFISIFGIAIQDAILVVTYFQRLRGSEGHSIEEAAREAAEKRLRPCLMTTLVAMLGLFPAALSNGIGAQTQKPLAIVVIGGALMLAVVARVIQPPLLVVAHRWLEEHGGGFGREPPGAPIEPEDFVQV